MFDTIFKMAFYTNHKSKCKYLRKHKAKIEIMFGCLFLSIILALSLG